MKREDSLKVVASLDELSYLSKLLRDKIPKNAIISLRGDLASGKTTLVQSLAKYIGCEEEVTSPTFSLQHNYGDRLYHYDLYRVDFEEIAQLGLLDEFEKEGWHMVEWMDERLKELLLSAGFELWEISIEPEGEKRIYRVGRIDETYSKS